MKNFPGAKDYVKLSVKENPDHLILHVRTNDLGSYKSPETIVKSVLVDVARLLKQESIGVIISKLVKCIDRFSEKAVEVNVFLKELCHEHNIYLIDHTNTIKTSHVNRIKLHLNRSSGSIFEKKIVISNIRPYLTYLLMKYANLIINKM